MPKKPALRAPVAAAPKPSPVRRWMREAIITGAVLLIVALILAKGLTEEIQALILGAVALVGAVYYTALPVAEQSKSRRVATGLYAFAVVWVLASGYPFWKLVQPGDPVRRVSLQAEGGEQGLGKLPPGRYLLLAQVPRAAVSSEAGYVLSVRGGGADADLRGHFSRTSTPRRLFARGQRSGESVHTAEYHEVQLGPGETKVRLESIKGSLRGPIHVDVFPDAAPHGPWLAAQLVLLLSAAVLDALFSERKRRSTITVGACFTLLFMEVARISIRPGRLVQPLIGAAIAALIGAAALGYLLNWLARVAAGAVRRRLA
jgi:hypothetical protein